MLFRLAYLGVTNTLAMLRPLPMSDRAKDAEILALREYEQHYNEHRPNRGISNAQPLHPLPEPLTDPARSRISQSADVTASGASSTSTNPPCDLHG
jgi:hypothetical protein